MWTTSLVGEAPREVLQNAVGQGVSPDGSRVAYTTNQNREIWTVGPQGDDPQRVLTLGERETVFRVVWAPNGGRLAYVCQKFRQTAGKIEGLGEIETCDLKGANRRVVVSDPELWDFTWVPQGKIVYTLGGGKGLWQIDVDRPKGSATNKPKRIINWAEFFASGLNATADGKQLVFCKRRPLNPQVYVGDLEPGGSRLRSYTKLRLMMPATGLFHGRTTAGRCSLRRRATA